MQATLGHATSDDLGASALRIPDRCTETRVLMETLKLANAVISIDVHGSLKIEKHNGDQIAVELFPNSVATLWVEG